MLRKKIEFVGNKGVFLSYANRAPFLSKLVYGGRVKLSLLQKVYPDKKKAFNILYLVSSSISIYARQMLAVCKSKGVKVVWNQNGVAYPAWAPETYKYINKPLAEGLRLADWVIYQSGFCKESADKYLGVREENFSILYNSVDTVLFSPLKQHRVSSPLCLLVMGSHEQAPRVMLALESLAVIRKKGFNAHLTIAGRLNWHRAKREVAEGICRLHLDSYVSIIGAYLQQEAPRLYCGAHILLHLKYADPCPSVVIESMACGTPVVGLNSGGVPELLADKGGEAIDINFSWDKCDYPHPERVVESVESIMGNWDFWSQAARKRAVEHFDEKTWIKAHKDVFNSVLKNK